MRHSLALLVSFATASLLFADDWPQWLGPKRDGSSAEIVKPWKEPLKILWKQTVGVESKKVNGHGSPVIVKGKVYLHLGVHGKAEEALAAFDAELGKPLWKESYERKPFKPLPIADFGSDPRDSPCVVGGKVYTFGVTRVLTCFDADSGKIIWQVDAGTDYKAPGLTFGSSSSPIVVDNHVIVNVGAPGASIVAFHKDTGKEVWKKLDDRASYASPIVIGQNELRQVIFLTASGLVSIAPKDGSVFWQHGFKDLLSESSTTPVVVDDILFASSITLGSIGLKLEHDRAIPGISKAWANPELTCYFGTPVAVGKDTLYVVTGGNPLAFKKSGATLRCIDARSGKEQWKRENVGTYHASLLRTGDNKLLLVEEKGDLVLIDPDRKEYRELSRTKICGPTWVHPALANGRLYIRDEKELVCVEMPK